MNVPIASSTSTSTLLSSTSLTPEQLLKNKQLTNRQKLKEVARQFEAILVRQILEDAQKSSKPSHALGQGVAEFYKDLTTGHLADAISRSGDLGLASALEKQMARQVLPSTPKPGPEGSAQPGPHRAHRP